MDDKDNNIVDLAKKKASRKNKGIGKGRGKRPNRKDTPPVIVPRKRHRPPTYETPEEMEVVIDLYFDDCSENGELPSVAGLAYMLGFTSRNAILNYECKPEFVGLIKAAKLWIEAAWERRLAGANCTGAIFTLKANFRWQEAAALTEVKATHRIEGDTIQKYKDWLAD